MRKPQEEEGCNREILLTDKLISTVGSFEEQPLGQYKPIIWWSWPLSCALEDWEPQKEVLVGKIRNGKV
jgi:hypothetical protein